METYRYEDVVEGLRSAGCVQPFLPGFITPLIEGGYAILSSREYARSACHFGRWMGLHGIAASRVTESTVEQFSRHRCTCPGASLSGRPPSDQYVRRVRRFVDYLRQVGISPAAPRPTSPPVPAPLRGFRPWMMQHRGVTERTIQRYERLVWKMVPNLGNDPAAYDGALVRRVFLDQVRGLGAVAARDYITALRAFLRYLEIEDKCSPGLHRAVPTIPQWRLSALPRYLEPGVVEQVIDSCDLSKPHGVRDRAVLLLLARLGLRAGDIVSMRLEDLDWEAGTVKVCGKSRREVVLPLPQDAGDAVLQYLLNARPTAPTDRVFLCANAPVRPLARSATVSSIVMLALRRAGVNDAPSRGAHVLRHSAATAMIRAGVGLDTIATVLRHQSADTTAYYAKVDVGLLQQVAQPWPEGAPC